MRRFALLAIAFLAVAAAMPPPPAPLQPYIKDGRFDPGDYGWMRGRFADASAADKTAMAETRRWIDACFVAGKAETRAELLAMGIADPKLERIDFREGLCAQVAMMPYPVDETSFAAFQHALATARPVADTYLLAVRVAEQSSLIHRETLRGALLARPLGEQMLRKAMSWGEGELKQAPPLGPTEKAILVARIGIVATELDRANTAWLKDLVARQGWPRISEVGEPAAQQAWLLVQHADADPAFQLKALRLMEPLIKAGEVSKQNYAYLYDRIMLKLTGRQRYATQTTCSGGNRKPLPLEDDAALPRLRSEAGLEPLTDYMALLDRAGGPCPPAARTEKQTD